LAFQTQTFWSVTGEKTVVVAPDNPTVRRRVEDMIVKAFYLGSLTTSREATELVTALRTLVSVNQVVVNSASNAIVIRDTADKIGLSEKIVTAFDPKATFSAPISSGAFANPMDRDARRSRLPLQLQLSSAGLLAARFNQSSRDTYDTVAGLAGIRVEFHPQFGNSPSFFFQVDSVDWITAMDTLAFQTETFWIPRDRQTILVASDNPTMRKEVIPEETKTIQWKNINSATAATEVVTMLRTLASLRDVQAAGPNAVTVTAVPDVIALSERLVALVDIAGRTPAAPPTTNPQNSPGNPPGPPPNFVPPPGPVAPGLIPFGSPFNNPNAPPQGTVLPPPFPAR
jgi:hypothetical protein